MDRRSMSYAENRTQMQVYNRSSSINTTWPSSNEAVIEQEKEPKLKRGGSLKLFTDPEIQRKRRVASYKAVGYQGKVKGSLKGSFKWVKEKCIQVVHGLW